MKLLKFYADWCGPCKALTPVLKDLLPNYPQIELEEVNIEQNKELLTKYNIRSVPVMVLVDSEGNPKNELKGFLADASFKRKIEDFLAGA